VKNPILFLIFNRIEETRKSFETIRKSKPPKLYISADGPREFVKGEYDVCETVREIATNVDWECQVFTLFNKSNLGCKMAIVNGINWFFDNEEQGIILEDDVIPKMEFFDFCDIMLKKYKDENSIKAVSGFNQFGQNVQSNTYYFSRGFYPWGWATWKTRWKNYKLDDFEISKLDREDIKLIYHKSAIEGIRFNLNIIKKGILDTWDYQMLFMLMVEKGYVVVPLANLTTNIGVNGAHSVNNQKIFFKYGSLAINQLVHPDIIEDDNFFNELLWKEYKEAYFLVRFKDILFKMKIYIIIRFFYKKIKILINNLKT
jgi:hypothetical protein